MTPTISRSRLVMEPSAGCETNAATGVGDVWSGLRLPRLVGPAPVACTPIHVTRPVVAIHHLPPQVPHLHLTGRERAECEQTHEAQGQRMLLAGQVA